MPDWNFVLLDTGAGNRSRWHAVVEGLPEKKRDVHFTPEYASIYELTNHHSARLAVFGDGDNYIVQPFILREIGDLPFMETESPSNHLYDIVNPYGYGGPLSNISDAHLEEGIFAAYLNAFHEYCAENGILFEFASTHPLLANHRPIEGYGFLHVTRRKPIVYIDLTRDERELWKGLSRGNRSSINKAKRLGVIVMREPVAGDSLEEFKRLYYETMERNSAGTRWWFPESYFHNCASCLGEEKISLFSARYQDQTIASFLVMHAYNTLYYHFGGSSEAYFEYRPNNVLMYEIALWGKAQGYGMYHLGGGQRHNDNLYRYKKGFSHDEAYLYTYYRIHNADEYSRLCLLKRQWDREHNIEIHDPGFLPEYRRE